jgi:hypothetical protein
MDTVLHWLEQIKQNWWLLAGVLAVLFALVVLQRLLGGVARLVRRRKTAPLHPKLQKYAGINDADVQAEHEAAAGIIATSSTGAIPGYEIVRQVEVLFVEGRRSQGEAIVALKAAAVQRGANAVINLGQEHTAAGRCTARGDAVVVRPTDTSRRPTPPKAAADVPLDMRSRAPEHRRGRP